jgi:hypothetical protein
MPLEELVRIMLGVTGKDGDRVREMLARGSLVAGASRFRWSGFESTPDEIVHYLTRFPDSDPAQRFDESRCFAAVLRGRSKVLTIEREAGAKKRLFRKRSFWEELMTHTASAGYVEYSWREQADIFRVRVDAEAQRRLADAGRLLAYSSYAARVQQAGWDAIDFLLRR